jgi:hypothetical protein
MSENNVKDFGFVDGNRLLGIVFPDEGSRPSLRWLERRVKRREIPSVKLGRMRLYSPEQVRIALVEAQGKGIGGAQ